MLVDLLSDAARRDPFPAYVHFRAASPLLNDPSSHLRLLFDYATVKEVLSTPDTFSSRHGPADWLTFQDPPRQTQLRALISKAFTPRSIATLEPRIRHLSRALLAPHLPAGRLDLAADYAVPLPMLVIADLLGIPPADRPRFIRWNDAILALSHLVPGGRSTSPDAARVMADFTRTTAEMGDYLATLLADRRDNPTDDLLTRLAASELDGVRLTQADLLGFFQLLLLAGSETTTNLINNAVLCFLEYPDQLALLRARPDLLPSAIEEVLRYRSPFQWMFRVTKRPVTLHGQDIPPGQRLLALIGSANRDPAVFPDPDRFDIARDPNPHLAFGHGTHFCLGAPLARLEARVALTDLLTHLPNFAPASPDPWPPRPGLHVHGPTHLPLLFTPTQF